MTSLSAATGAVLLLLAAACLAEVNDCPTICPMLYAPLCASNGVTYGNSCLMRGAACRSGTELSIVSPGPCMSIGGQTVPAVSKRNLKCPKLCADIYKPVCGSDGNTYGNECELDVAACGTSASVLKLVSYGECSATDAPTASAPASPSDCNVMCPMHYDPVCASDGNTYGNECSMNATACELGKPLKIVSRGECPDEEVVSKVPETKCLGICPMIYFPVCGSDGQTYGNECELKHQACISGGALSVAHSGKCVEKATTPCHIACFALYAPVCGSDGQTYSNECVLKASAACQKGVTSLTVASQGECPLVTDTCKVVPCTKIYDPVCGSDKKIYGNRCLFSNAQCEQQIEGKKLEEASSSLYCELGN